MSKFAHFSVTLSLNNILRVTQSSLNFRDFVTDVVNSVFISIGTHVFSSDGSRHSLLQSNFFGAGCKIMQHYVTNLYNIMQHYVIRGDISPHFRRLIAVNDRFGGDNLIGI